MANPFSKTDPIMFALAKKYTVKPFRRPTEDRFEYLAHTILYQQLSTKAAAVISRRFSALFNPLPSPEGTEETRHTKNNIFPTPENILNTPDEILRGVGISWAKVKYIKDLARKASSCKHVSGKACTNTNIKTPTSLSLRGVRQLADATPARQCQSLAGGKQSSGSSKYLDRHAHKASLAMTTECEHINLGILHKLSDEEVIAELTKVKGIGRWTAEMFLMSALARPDIFSFGDLGLQTAIKKAYGFKKLPSKRTMERLSKKWSPHKTLAARILWASLDNE